MIPFGFPSESMGTTLGIASYAKGYGQDQLLIGAAVWASEDEAVGGVLGMWDYRLPVGNRLFFTLFGSAGYYPRQRAYALPIYEIGVPRPGSNDSGKDDFLETGGQNNWIDLKLEYVLPIGSARDDAIMTYRLKDGELISPPTGGATWNPLKTGVSVLMLRQYSYYQNFETSDKYIERTIHPLELGLYYNNTDFPANPSFGSSQFVSITYDFAWGESKATWAFIEFEASKYFSLGKSNIARQRVVALDFWTGNSPTWEEEYLGNGLYTIKNRPPYFTGATLGGYYRMRGYPFNRFNDQAVIYTGAEYRYTPYWNPIGNVSWLRFLKMDWWQFAGFVEGGRVSDAYSIDTLLRDWKVDAGFGIRAMVAGGVVRFDAGFSNEGANAWVMFGQPF